MAKTSPAAPPPPETIMVPPDTDEVSCDGGGGALGHPKVWYSFDNKNAVDCAYCDRHFVKQGADIGHS